jgi:hypothetical protein
MSRRFGHFLAALYAVLAIGLFRCATVSYQHRSVGYVAFFAAASIGFAVAILHHSLQRDELRAAHARLNAATRPTQDFTTHQDDAVRLALASWCCDPAVITAGADHDPEHCTRKGHHA